MSGKANIGVVGLGVMGSNLARNLAHHGHTVAVYNRSAPATERLIRDHGSEGEFIPSTTIADFVASLEKPRTAILLVKAGEATDATIKLLADEMEEGDIIVDGGNSLFTDTIRREREIRERGLHFVGAGVSGGEVGALEGPSIMPGGTAESYRTLGPILESIAAKVDGVPCVTHIGTDGAGHFVKMVHNGIEYADMQLIAESYDLLRRGAGLEPAEIADIFDEWNRGELNSYLVEITAEVLRQVDAKTGRPFVDVVVDQAGMKGTGTWTVQTALQLGVPVTGISEAVFSRALSSQPAQRAAAGSLRGPDGSLPITDKDAFVEAVRRALYASKIVAYAQGFDEIAFGAEEYGWDIDLAAVARIWRGGCIIRAIFLNRITDAYSGRTKPVSMLLDDYFTKAIDGAQDAWRRVVANATLVGIPVPAFSSSLAYYDGLRAERLPASLIQAQRDYFGAHTYQRIDMAGTFHTLWSGDRTEIEA